MNTKYVLPVGVSLVLHAGLLLGFNKPHHLHSGRTVTPAEPRPVGVCFLVLPPTEPEVMLRPDDQRRPEAITRPDMNPSSDPRVAPGIPVITSPASIRIENSGVPIIGSPGGIDPAIFLPGVPVVFDSRHLDNVPRAKTQIAPTYPFEARQNKINGKVIVAFNVDKEGYVHEAHVEESSDHVFDEAALRAVSKWRFEPGIKNGQRVRFRMALPMVFTVS